MRRPIPRHPGLNRRHWGPATTVSRGRRSVECSTCPQGSTGDVLTSTSRHCLIRRASNSSSALVPLPVFEIAVHVVADEGWCRL